MKKVIEDHYVLRRDFRVKQEVDNEIQTIISYIKDKLQNFIEENTIVKTRKGKSFWLQGNGLKIVHYESYGKQIKNLTQHQRI